MKDREKRRLFARDGAAGAKNSGKRGTKNTKYCGFSAAKIFIQKLSQKLQKSLAIFRQSC